MPKQPSEAVVDAWIALDRAQQTALLKDRARLPARETPLARLVRRPLGARPGGQVRAAALRDREADVDRAVQHFAPDRSLGRAWVRRASAVRGGWPRPVRGHHAGRARVCGSGCGRSMREPSAKPSVITSRSGKRRTWQACLRGWQLDEHEPVVAEWGSAEIPA